MTGRRPHRGAVGIWAGDFDSAPVAAVRAAAAAAAEELGYGTLWLNETAGREAMAQAAFLLPVTRRIFVATGGADIYDASARPLEEQPHPREDVRGHRSAHRRPG